MVFNIYILLQILNIKKPAKMTSVHKFMTKGCKTLTDDDTDKTEHFIYL